MSLVTLKHEGIVGQHKGNHSPIGRISVRTEYSIFNIDWYMRNTYDVSGYSPGAGNKVEFCTNHSTFALVKFIKTVGVTYFTRR